jgi:hypothetical protein
MKRGLFSLACFYFATVSLAAPAKWQETFLSQRMRAATVWETKDGDLVCGIQDKWEGESAVAVLSCFTKSSGGEKRVANITLDPGVIEIHVLQSPEGPLWVTAGSGSGLVFRAYIYTGGRVKKVWEDGSFVPAETFFADNQGDVTIVALGEPEWRTVANGTKQRVIGTARLFAWTGRGFDGLGQVPWENRLSAAAKAVAEKGLANKKEPASLK